MLKIYKPTNGKLKSLDKPHKSCWINVINPTKKDIAKLRSYINIPDEIFFSLEDMDEIPTIEKHDQFIFVIIRTPQKHKQIKELEYSTIPLGILVSSDYIITICYHDNDAVRDLKSQKFIASGIQPILMLLLVSAKLYLNYLKIINKKISVVQHYLKKSNKNKEILQLLDLEKSLVYFNTSLKSNELMIKRVAKNKDFTMTKIDKELLDDVIEETRQAIEVTAIYSNILSSMMDAFASIISNNLNIIIKLLTSVTIILMIPTLVASVYGMNVNLPFQHSPYAFAITLIISISLSILSVLIFLRKEFF